MKRLVLAFSLLFALPAAYAQDAGSTDLAEVADAVASEVAPDAAPTVNVDAAVAPAPAPAPPAVTPPNPEADPIGFFLSIWNGIRSGDWPLVTALALIGLILLARKVLVPIFPVLKEDIPAWFFAMGVTFIGAVANALFAGSAVSAGMIWTAVLYSWTASGGYSGLHRLLPKFIAWVKGLFGVK
jgi:hypothetical protein